MESTLVIVTLVSLALASAMSLLTWRMVTRERRRESARVAALVDLAREDDDLLLAPGPGTPAAPRLRNAERGTPQASPKLEDTSSGLFAATERESPAGRRFVAVIAVAAVMVVGVGVLMFAGRESSGGSQTEVSTGGTTTGEPSAVGTAGVPLELLSLRHERDGERLMITGLVLNPRHGARIERASAVVFVFDPAGTFVASGRALIDFTKLDPGNESPFVVTVIAPGKIGRYRIGFRGQDGAVVGHVDRRVGT